MGLPSILTTDNGSEFRNKLKNAMMKQLGIRHCLITPYHPQVHKVYNFSLKFPISLFLSSQMVLKNDTIELLQRMLSKAVMGHKEIWDQFTDSAVFTYNTSSHESTNYTPFEEMLEERRGYLLMQTMESICELLRLLPKLDLVLFFNLHCT